MKERMSNEAKKSWKKQKPPRPLSFENSGIFSGKLSRI